MASEYFIINGNADNMIIEDYGCHGTRNMTTLSVIMHTIKHYNIRNNISLGVCTGDIECFTPFDAKPPIFKQIKNVAYTTSNKNYANLCPDFFFGGEPALGIYSWDNLCDDIRNNGNTTSQIKKIGWRGGVGEIEMRHKLIEFSSNHSDIMDCLDCGWTGYDEKIKQSVGNNFVPLHKQPRIWEYLIDVEGKGYSARAKALLFSNRILFFVERTNVEWWHQYFEPWVHYVPVRRDFSDLIENYERIESDLNLKKSIIKNARRFALNNLRYWNAVYRWKDILTNV